MKFDIQKEYINIDHYSPFSHINEVSKEFQKLPFQLPFIFIHGEKRPVHPDTFNDLHLGEDKTVEVLETKLVYPTSSFRTVYCPEDNFFYKLPLLRKITRSLRDLAPKELNRSVAAGNLLKSQHFPGFSFLKEECHFAEDANYNYIVRKMPKENGMDGDNNAGKELNPWFYVISSGKFSKEYELGCVEKMISSWMYFASKGIIFESFHTQNLLFDENKNLYYRDLSDVRSADVPILMPSYYDKLSGFSEFLSIAFDRSVCNQNLDHLFRYDKRLDDGDRELVKGIIKREIVKYDLHFPDYSMDYSKASVARIPEKIKLVSWRSK